MGRKRGNVSLYVKNVNKNLLGKGYSEGWIYDKISNIGDLVKKEGLI